MTARPVTRALFRCDGASVRQELERERWTQKESIRSRGPNPDLNLVVDNLLSKVVGEIDPVVLDLVHVAAYCYAADLMVQRGGPIDVHREGWRREMALCVPVNEPDRWSDPETLSFLTEALGFLTEDTWTFDFQQAPPDMVQTPLGWKPKEVLERPDSVVLFSGGVDSLCAAVGEVHDHGGTPVLVGHCPARHVRARQSRLRKEMKGRLPGKELPLIPFGIHRRGEAEAGSTQRTRGFLFACLGAATAAHLGVGRVLLADNGYVSINPPISDQLVGALASRGTHPKYLFLVDRFLGRLLGGAVTITNPLRDRTRAEALGALVRAGCPELLAHAYTCGKHRTRETGKRHCGGCSQCVDRRFAAVRAGLEAHDPLEHYELDVFADPLPVGELRTVPLSYVRFANEVHKGDADHIFEDYPQLDLCLHPDDPGMDDLALAIGDLLKRHAAETLAVMDAKYAEVIEAVTRHALPEDGLLRRWLGDGTRPDDGGDYGVPDEPPRSWIARKGKVWIAQFRDEVGGVRNNAGAPRLARLLKANGQGIEALGLVAGSVANPSRSGRMVVTTTASPGGPPKARDESPTRTGRQGDAGEIVDEKALKMYMARKGELEGEIRVLEAAGRGGIEADVRRREVAWLDDHLRGALGQGDRPRAEPEEHERARNTVSKTVWASVDELRTQMPLLHAHLRRFLRLGYLCSYDPDPPEHWDVAL